MNSYNELNITLKAIGDSNRLRIIGVLAHRPHAVGDIVVTLRLSQPLVSKHLSVLSKAGLVESHVVAQKRIYVLKPKPFKELDVWLNSFRKLWDTKLDRLDAYLKKIQKEQTK